MNECLYELTLQTLLDTIQLPTTRLEIRAVEWEDDDYNSKQVTNTIFKDTFNALDFMSIRRYLYWYVNAISIQDNTLIILVGR